MENQRSIHYYPESVTFGFHTANDIKKISVVEVTQPDTFNALGHPITNGLYDLQMGPYNEDAGKCPTCSLGFKFCPGHFGHIALPLPCYHPLFIRNIVSIIKMTCPVCKTFTIPEVEKVLLVGQLQLLKYGLIAEAHNLWQKVKPIEEDYDEEEGKTSQLTEEQLCELRMNIQEEIDRAKKEAGISCGDNPPLTRNVENLKMEFLKLFMQKFQAGKKKCAQGCKGGFDKVQQYRSRIVYSLKHDTPTTSLGGNMLMNPIELDENSDDEADKEAKTPSKHKRQPRATMYVTPNDARDLLRTLWKKERELFGQLYPVLLKTNIENPSDVFFLDVISVMPPKFRPVNVVAGLMSDNKQTTVLRKIVNDTYIVKTALFCYEQKSTDNIHEDSQRLLSSLQGQSLLEKLQTAWHGLQENVNMILDTSKNKDAKSLVGFKQVLEKKEGLLRMNMMGKRVNFAARSVITPDPNLDVEEVGVPDCFAKKLTFPTPVTAFNVCEMRDAVRNGPNVWPGALCIEESNGKKIFLNPNDDKARAAIAKTLLTPFEACSQSTVYDKHGKIRTLFQPKIVHRHLKTGDVMLLNRQPTLHKPSMMAHKARVLMGEKTLRLHYANCKAYNADFDGDEMNAHFPQGEVARSEGYNIAAVPHQYLVPKDGTPLSGLIQDHMIAGVKLTMRGQFFNRADYQQLVFAGMGGREYDGKTKLLPPTILKPVALWSGKQILSSVIINLTPKDRQLINMNSTAKISIKDWQTVPPRKWNGGGLELQGNNMTENEVIIQHGELLVGVLDKMHYGSTSYSLVHLFNELYGGQYSCRLLSCFSRLFTAYLQLKGFSLGVEDILVTPQADKKRKKILKRLEKIGDLVAAKAVGVTPEQVEKCGMEIVRKKMEEVHFSQSAIKKMAIDREYKGMTDKINNDVNRACIPGGLHKLFPDNNLALMIQSGAKGSSVNAMQISCLLGQIELEGKRPPLMISGRSLPSFLAYDTSPRAGGFISGRFMTGIRPQEFFFHCMAGREGLIDTAVKTSRSGYLQRCLVKHLEGVAVAYDGTVRDSDGLVLQFLYGEDGLDICKSQFLNDKGLPFLVANRECVRLIEPVADESEQKQVDRAKKLVKRWLDKHGSLNKEKERKSGFLNFSSQCGVVESNENGKNGRTVAAIEIQKSWLALSAEERSTYSKKTGSPPDPVNAKFSFTRHMDVFDEQLNAIMSRYLDRSTQSIQRKDLTRLVYNKAVAASCEPGEPVGLLAAQSIGEPSTQMTLNTFHFAGRGEMNVTLGIPRLREILMVAAANLQTPSMDIPLLSKGPKALRKAERLKLKLTRVALADVLENVHITEGLSIRDGERTRIYGLTFNFLPHASYKDRFCVKPKKVLQFFEKTFLFKVLLPLMKKEAEAQGKQSLFECKTANQARKAAAKEDDEMEGNAEEGETSNGRAKENDDENDDSDDGSNANDDDFATQRGKDADEHEYEDEDETDKEPVDEDGFGEEIHEKKKEDGDESDNEESNDKTMNDEDLAFEVAPSKEEMDLEKAEAYEVHKMAVINEHSWIIDYDFDSTAFLNCTVTLSVPLFVEKVDLSSSLKKWAESTVVHHVPNIKRAFVIAPESDDGDIVIKTDGVNIRAMFEHAEILDINRLYTNDIHQVAKHYGVEAASRVIVKEVNNVFKVYGITVDPRHLSLVASFMTSGGSYRSFSRHGMADCTSPFQQMSFETATEFLKNATLQGKTDFLKTPSSRLIMGLPGCEGTGSFSLMAKLY